MLTIKVCIFTIDVIVFHRLLYFDFCIDFVEIYDRCCLYQIGRPIWKEVVAVLYCLLLVLYKPNMTSCPAGKHEVFTQRRFNVGTAS